MWLQTQSNTRRATHSASIIDRMTEIYLTGRMPATSKNNLTYFIRVVIQGLEEGRLLFRPRTDVCL